MEGESDGVEFGEDIGLIKKEYVISCKKIKNKKLMLNQQENKIVLI